MKKGFTTCSRYKKVSRKEIKAYFNMLENLNMIKVERKEETIISYRIEKDGQLCLFV